MQQTKRVFHKQAWRRTFKFDQTIGRRNLFFPVGTHTPFPHFNVEPNDANKYLCQTTLPNNPEFNFDVGGAGVDAGKNKSRLRYCRAWSFIHTTTSDDDDERQTRRRHRNASLFEGSPGPMKHDVFCGTWLLGALCSRLGNLGSALVLSKSFPTTCPDQ